MENKSCSPAPTLSESNISYGMHGRTREEVEATSATATRPFALLPPFGVVSFQAHKRMLFRGRLKALHPSDVDAGAAGPERAFE